MPVGGTRDCAQCGKPFAFTRNVRAKYCSQACCHKAYERRKGVRPPEERYERMRSAWPQCECCRQRFKPHNRGAAVAHIKPRWCSMACRVQYNKCLRDAGLLGRQPKAKYTSIVRCASCARYIPAIRKRCAPCATKHNMAVVARRAAELAETSCAVCGERYRRRTYPWPWRGCCSAACKAAQKSGAGKRRGESHYRRAKSRGARAEVIYRAKVFERDGWRCYLCGQETPKLLLKDFASPMAPTIDHVVPLTKGGEHTYANVRCACRRCNSLKGDKMWGGECSPKIWSERSQIGRAHV